MEDSGLKNMKSKLLPALLLTAALLAPAAVPAQTTNHPVSAVTLEMQTIIKSVSEKIKANAGKVTEADLAADLASFDSLLAKHAGEKTDEVARVAYMKAMLYGQVLHDEMKADTLTKKLKEDFKGTSFVTRLEKQEAAAAEAKAKQSALAAGKPFPDFSEKDLAGQPLSVGNYKGKVVLVDFWATWCGPCRGELPNVIAAYKKFHGQGFEIIGVSLDSDRAKLDDFLKKQDGMTWAQYFDGLGWENKLAGKYGVQSIPFTVLVGPDGNVIGTDLRGEALEPAITAALAKK